MSFFPAVTAKELIKVIQQIGFKEHHQSGFVPCHAGRIIPRKTLKAILLDADLTIEKFKELL